MKPVCVSGMRPFVPAGGGGGAGISNCPSRALEVAEVLRRRKSDMNPWNSRSEQIAPKSPGAPTPAWSPREDGRIPYPHRLTGPQRHKAPKSALSTWALTPGTRLGHSSGQSVHRSCNHSRIDEFGSRAHLVEGKHVSKASSSPDLPPAPAAIKSQAEKEGLAKIFTDAAFFCFQCLERGCHICIA